MLLFFMFKNTSLLVGQDSVWGGTESSLLYQSNHSASQQQQHRFETVTSGKKKKKQKMVRADPSLLGETPCGNTGKQHFQLTHVWPSAFVERNLKKVLHFKLL